MVPQKRALDCEGEEDSSDEEPLWQRAKRLEARDDSDSSSEDGEENLEEGTITDDEQDLKEMVVVPFSRQEQPADEHEVKELIIQDMKTEDELEPGGYSRRRVGKGSVVVVRGQDEETGETVTWVALVKKVFRDSKNQGRLMVGFNWFYRKPDLPSEAARRAVPTDDPRLLLFSGCEDVTEARFIRHPAQAWFLSKSAPDPLMRCGQGQLRHTRRRPGFLVRYVFDPAGKGKVYAIGDESLARRQPALAKEVNSLVSRSKRELQALADEEAAYDAQQQLAGVEAGPFVRPEEQAWEREGEEADDGGGEEDVVEIPSSSSTSTSSSDSDSDSEEGSRQQEGGVLPLPEQGAAAGLQGGGSAADDAQGVAASAVAGTALSPEAAAQAKREQQEQERVQQQVDADARLLAQLLPQLALQPQAPGHAPGVSGSVGDAAAVAKVWRRPAAQLLRQAGELVRRQAPPPLKNGGAGAGVAGFASLHPREVAQLVQGATLPSSEALGELLRAIINTTQEAAQELLEHQMFVRALLTWLWRLAPPHSLAQQQGQQPSDPQSFQSAALVLRAMERCPYTAAVDRWITSVQGHSLIQELQQQKQAQQAPYPEPLQQAAANLKRLWRASAQRLRQVQRERQRQRQEEERQQQQLVDRQRDRKEQRLLHQSPQASRVVGMATSGRRLSALGASSGLPYVRPRASPQVMGGGAQRGPGSASPAPMAHAPTPPDKHALAALQEQQRQQAAASLPPRPQQQQQEEKQQQQQQQPEARKVQQPQPQAQQQSQQQLSKLQPATGTPAAAAAAAAAAAPQDALSARWLSAFAGGASAGTSRQLPASKQQQDRTPLTAAAAAVPSSRSLPRPGASSAVDAAQQAQREQAVPRSASAPAPAAAATPSAGTAGGRSGGGAERPVAAAAVLAAGQKRRQPESSEGAGAAAARNQPAAKAARLEGQQRRQERHGKGAGTGAGAAIAAAVAAQAEVLAEAGEAWPEAAASDMPAGHEGASSSECSSSSEGGSGSEDEGRAGRRAARERAQLGSGGAQAEGQQAHRRLQQSKPKLTAMLKKHQKR